VRRSPEHPARRADEWEASGRLWYHRRLTDLRAAQVHKRRSLPPVPDSLGVDDHCGPRPDDRARVEPTVVAPATSGTGTPVGS